MNINRVVSITAILMATAIAGCAGYPYHGGYSAAGYRYGAGYPRPAPYGYYGNGYQAPQPYRPEYHEYREHAYQPYREHEEHRWGGGNEHRWGGENGQGWNRGRRDDD